MELDEIIDKRYSVRDFSDKQVEKEKLEQILKVARLAPTARNRQPQRIKIIERADELALIDACTENRYNAPLALFVCYDKTGGQSNRHNATIKSGDIDCAITITYMMLMATNLGLGSLWVKSFDHEKAQKLFCLNDDIVPVSFLMLGYPTSNCIPSKNHFARKELSELLI